MFAHERHREILNLLRKHRRMDVQALTEQLGISPATLRREDTQNPQLHRQGQRLRYRTWFHPVC
jgi:DeoR/GlpR family transcriptional regulator of sugar metabolism